MIKTIELRNFQAHKSTSLNLSSGVNVIKGQSHSGKTAIIRALRWALANKPGGESFRSWFAEKKDSVSVAVEFDDGYIVRSRSSGNNGYKLKHNGKDVLELSAIGRDLPQEVSNFTRMNDLNLQCQHDAYFMLQDSAASALQRLNEIVGLTIIDETLKAANQKNNRLLNDLRSTETRIEEIGNELKALDYLEFVGKIIEKIIADVENIDRCRKECIELSNLLSSIESTEETIEECEEILQLEEQYEAVRMTIRHLKSIRYQVSETLNILSAIKHYEKEVSECSEFLSVEPAASALLGLSRTFEKTQSERQSLERICHSIRKLRKSINDTSEMLESRQMEYDRILMDVGICPLCGNKIEF